MWVEQLIAESTGKLGLGILPVAGETPTEPAFYDNDRLFAYLRLAGDNNAELDGWVDLLIGAGHPVVTIQMDELEDLGQEFFRWEMATAAAGAISADQPL